MCRVALENTDYTGYDSRCVGPRLEWVPERVNLVATSAQFVAVGDMEVLSFNTSCHMCAERTEEVYQYRPVVTEEMEKLVWTQYQKIMGTPGSQRHGQAIMNACAIYIPGWEDTFISTDVWQLDYPYAAIYYMKQVREICS